jgi:hypothetical protein
MGALLGTLEQDSAPGVSILEREQILGLMLS